MKQNRIINHSEKMRYNTTVKDTEMGVKRTKSNTVPRKNIVVVAIKIYIKYQETAYPQALQVTL